MIFQSDQLISVDDWTFSDQPRDVGLQVAIQEYDLATRRWVYRSVNSCLSTAGSELEPDGKCGLADFNRYIMIVHDDNIHIYDIHVKPNSYHNIHIRFKYHHRSSFNCKKPNNSHLWLHQFEVRFKAVGCLPWYVSDHRGRCWNWTEMCTPSAEANCNLVAAWFGFFCFGWRYSWWKFAWFEMWLS